MPMCCNGYTKLVEEASELITVLAKKQAYWGTDHHPDGSNQNDRIVEEIADVLAAIEFAIAKNQLDRKKITDRAFSKLKTYRTWDQEEYTEAEVNPDLGSFVQADVWGLV